MSSQVRNFGLEDAYQFNSRHARFCFSGGEASCIRGWLLLARLPSVLQNAQDPSAILAHEDRNQSETRRVDQASLEPTRLASAENLGT